MCQWLFTLQSFKYQGCRSERGGKHDLSFSFSLFILYIYHSGNQRHSINASFQFYFVLELKVHFLPFITQCSNAPAQPDHINT